MSNPATAASASSTALEVRDLYKSFGPLEVLKGVSVSAREGDVIALIGASGSGKSTLLRCLNLLETPDSGDVYVQGELINMKKGRHGQEPADRKQVDRIRTKLGMVFQSFNLWSHMTVLENIIEAPIHVLGLSKAEATERAEALLDKVGIADKRGHYSGHLSGGQQQRAAIARALAMEPEVMLFDEATSALDPELVGEVLKVIRDLADEGRTMLLVTHEMGFAREVASEVIYLHEGHIEEQGTPAEVFENPKSERCRQFLASNLG
jgi:octopine/nopaline transport system ATP-binding protein